ncbi:MAG TPA: tRNA (adenosine(37)-N6)-threonylcarbamoyltransferase complex transferase subunit TsaD [Chlamydiales bacterium]|nr:tRNA (adenosine(37)-N6)-threonylcarbamoyltransferase complex transferase subunit TsaD [Chlamydiales bacterium]
MIILGIETTCDETSISVVENGVSILSNVIYSQIDLHKPFGGVFPELASREHLNRILPVLEQSLKEANVTHQDIDLIAVAHGPGLIGSLLVGLNTAKALSLAWDIPYIGINHIEAHLYAAMMCHYEQLTFPSLGIVVSGGHTMLVKISNIGKYSLIGTTIDDAVGEAFDKVAAMLGLPYPGGPEIEKLAQTGNLNKYPFAAGKVKEKPFHFSFSGLKTKVLYTLKGQNNDAKSTSILNENEKKHIAASFQNAALSDIYQKAEKAVKEYSLKAVYVGGGVSNNNVLKNSLKRLSVPSYFPTPRLTLDNAAMIAGLAYHKYSKPASYDLEAKTRIPMC